MTPAEIIAIGRLAGETLNLALKQLPTRDQRKMDAFFKLIDQYNSEIKRKDSDHDDLIVWRERIDSLTRTVLSELQKGRK